MKSRLENPLNEVEESMKRSFKSRIKVKDDQDAISARFNRVKIAIDEGDFEIAKWQAGQLKGDGRLLDDVVNPLLEALDYEIKVAAEAARYIEDPQKFITEIIMDAATKARKLLWTGCIICAILGAIIVVVVMDISHSAVIADKNAEITELQEAIKPLQTLPMITMEQVTACEKGINTLCPLIFRQKQNSLTVFRDDDFGETFAVLIRKYRKSEDSYAAEIYRIVPEPNK